MPKMYKKSLVATVDTAQIPIMKKAGWKLQAPSKKKVLLSSDKEADNANEPATATKSPDKAVEDNKALGKKPTAAPNK